MKEDILNKNSSTANQNGDKIESQSSFPFKDEIKRFIKHIESQINVVPLVMSLLNMKLLQELKHLNKFSESNGIVEKKNNENEAQLEIPSGIIYEFLKLANNCETTGLANKLLPINFVVSFVSQYDAYLGGIIRAMYHAKPELLNSSEKNISLSELIKFADIEEARQTLIEKEVESVLRESHLKQFLWLESKLGIPLRKDLPSFSAFIEITERRNLFVHCNGVVSRQYLNVCNDNEVPNIEKIKVGEKLYAKNEYLTQCYSVLFEIGVKLGQVIWRKLKPEELKEADNNLSSICYDLVVKEHYNLAFNLLTFATDGLKKHFDQEIISIFIINKALCKYLSGKIEDCKQILQQHDWSASNDIFKLAIAVLNDEYQPALEIMKSIGSSNSKLTKDSYREWPLFKKFRKTDEFKKIYRDIFGEELVYIEPKPKNVEDILAELKKYKEEEDLKEKELEQTS